MTDLPTTIRNYSFESEGYTNLVIHEDPVGIWAGGVGSTVWDAALVLSKYIEKLSAQVDQKMVKNGAKVIELGSGTGLVGMVLARCFEGKVAEVVLTDKISSLPLLRKNVHENYKRQDITPNIVVMELDWQQDIDKNDAIRSPYDLILLSDVVWNESLYVPLLKTLISLSGNNTVILLAYEKRYFEKEIEFFREFGAKFGFFNVKEEELDETWKSEDIFVFQGWKKELMSG